MVVSCELAMGKHPAIVLMLTIQMPLALFSSTSQQQARLRGSGASCPAMCDGEASPRSSIRNAGLSDAYLARFSARDLFCRRGQTLHLRGGWLGGGAQAKTSSPFMHAHVYKCVGWHVPARVYDGLAHSRFLCTHHPDGLPPLKRCPVHRYGTAQAVPGSGRRRFRRNSPATTTRSYLLDAKRRSKIQQNSREKRQLV